MRMTSFRRVVAPVAGADRRVPAARVGPVRTVLAAAGCALAATCFLTPGGAAAQDAKVEIGGDRAAPAPEASKKIGKPQITREEVETILPLFLRSEQSRELAAALEAQLRQGDFVAARTLVEGFAEASTFSVLAIDWIEDPGLVRMLHAQGIRGSDTPPAPAPGAEEEVRTALAQERGRTETLARELALARERLTELETMRDGAAAEAAGIAEIRQAAEAESARAEALGRELAVVTEKLASLEAAHERGAAVFAEAAQLRAALERETARAEALTRDHAAATGRLAALQGTQDQSSAAAAEAAQLRAALERETARAEALARDHAGATERLASLAAAEERALALAAETAELRTSVERETARAEAAERAQAAAREENAGLRREHERYRTAAAELAEVRTILKQERARGEALVRDHAAASQKLATSQAALESGSAAVAEVATLRAALERETARAEALSRERGVAAEKVAALEAAQDGGNAAAAAEIAELRRALHEERTRGVTLAREHAAATEKLAGVAKASLSTAAVPSASSDRPRPSGAPASENAASGIGVVPSDSPMIKRADALLRSGDVSGARLLLERAADTGDARAMRLLAESYDPRVLAALKVRGMRGDRAKAEELYARARDRTGAAGSARAETAPAQ